MADLKIYIDNDEPMYKKKVAVFKILWEDYKKTGKVDEAKAKRLFTPVVNDAARYAKSWKESVSRQDIDQAIKECIEEFKVEQIQYKNYWSD